MELSNLNIKKMCKICNSQVEEMGIFPSDLPNLPFKLVKWKCMVKNCNHYKRVKDYGIKPFYRFGNKNAEWLDSFAHNFLCGKHFPIWKRRHIPNLEDPLFPTPKSKEEFEANIIEIKKASK